MQALRITLVEDDPQLSVVLVDYLQREGFAVTQLGDGLSAARFVSHAVTDLLLLDLMLPGCDGLEVCRRVRGHFRGPILMLTARSADVDEILGLELGADDYVRKPVDPRVLVARVRALSRRLTPGSQLSKKRSFGALELDPHRREVRVNGRSVELTSAELDLLCVLAERPGFVFTREELHRLLRGVEYDGLDRSIDLRVSRIRRKLGALGAELVRSVRGVGYQLAVDPCDSA